MLNKVLDIIDSKRFFQLLLCGVLMFLMLHIAIEQVHAFELVPFPDSWEGLSGYGRFLSPSLYYDLDIQVLSWNDPIEKVFYGVASSLFSIYKNLTKMFVIAYYYIVTFELHEILKPAVVLMFGAFKKTFIDDMRGFLSTFLLSGIVIYYGKQNFQKLWKTLFTFFALIAVSGYLVSNADSIYTETFSTIQEINGAVTTSVLSNSEDIDDSYLEATGTFWYSLFVEPYTQVNGEGKLSLSQMEEMIQYPYGSEERDALTKQHHEEYGIFSRNFLQSIGKATAFIAVALVIIIEVAVIVMIAAIGIVQQLMLIIMFALLPIVMALATIEFFGGLSVLRRYGITAGQTLLTMVMVGVVLGFTSLFDNAIASTSYPWLVKILFRAVIYVAIFKYHDRLFDMFSKLIGIKMLGYDPAKDMPYIPYLNDKKGDKKSDGGSNRNSEDNPNVNNNRNNDSPGDMPDPEDRGNNQNGRDHNSKMADPKDMNEPTKKQMKFARDLEKKNNIVNDEDLKDMSRQEMSDYIKSMQNPEDDEETDKSIHRDFINPEDEQQDNDINSMDDPEDSDYDTREDTNYPEQHVDPDYPQEDTDVSANDDVDVDEELHMNEPEADPLDYSDKEVVPDEYGSHSDESENPTLPNTRRDISSNNREEIIRKASEDRGIAYKRKHRDVYASAKKNDTEIDHINLDDLSDNDREQLQFELNSGYEGGIYERETEKVVKSYEDSKVGADKVFNDDYEQLMKRFKDK